MVTLQCNLMRKISFVATAILMLTFNSVTEARSADSELESLERLQDLPMRITYDVNSTATQLQDNIVSRDNGQVKVPLPDVTNNGTPATAWMRQSGMAKNGLVETVGSVKYEVVSQGKQVKLSLFSSGGDPAGVFFYDGTNSYVAIYPEGDNVPRVTELPGRRFVFNYYRLNKYRDLFGSALEEMPGLRQVEDMVFADRETSPTYSFTFDKENSRLMAQRNYSPAQETGTEFSNFVEVEGSILPSRVREYQKNAGGAIILDIVFDNIQYEILTLDELKAEFGDPVFNVGVPMSDSAPRAIMESTSKASGE